MLKCVVDVDDDADGDDELGWRRWRWTLLVFSAADGDDSRERWPLDRKDSRSTAQ